MRASASKRLVTRAQVYKRDSSGVAPASPQVTYRALLERAGSLEPADRGGVDRIGPRDIGLRLACSKALERFLALMGRHLARASEANAALLARLRPSPAEGRKCGQLFSVGGQCTFEQGAVGDLGGSRRDAARVAFVRLGRALTGAGWRSRAFECRAYRQSGTAEIHRRGPKMQPTFFRSSTRSGFFPDH